MSVATLENKNKIVNQYEVWLADLGKSNGSVQRGVRPVLVISNNIGNSRSSVVIVVPITSSSTKKRIPTQVHISAVDVGFVKDSIIQFEQIFTVSKEYDLKYKLTTIPERYHGQLKKALEISTPL
jgi:mRNA interferase MazF